MITLKSVNKDPDNNKERFNEIDLLKALSIITVILIHSKFSVFFISDPIEKFIDDINRFAVPGLLFAAGFLFKKNEKDDIHRLKQIFIRIIPPYLCVSLIIIFFNLPGNECTYSILPILMCLIFTNAVGPFYYVFVILYLYAFSFIFKRLDVTIMKLLWLISIILLILFFKYTLFFIPVKDPKSFIMFMMRHPMLHLAPYLTGWIFSLYYAGIRDFLARNFTAIICISITAEILLLYSLWGGSTNPFKIQMLIQVHIYLVILIVTLLGIRGISNLVIIFLSNASYAIFLLHFPIVGFIKILLAEHYQQFSLNYCVLIWLSSTTASIILILVIKRILKQYSRYIIGY